MAKDTTTIEIDDSTIRQAVAAKVFEALTSEERVLIVRELVDRTLGKKVHATTLGQAVPNDSMNAPLLPALIEKLVIEHAQQLIGGYIREIAEEVEQVVREAFMQSWRAHAVKVADDVTAKAMERLLASTRGY